jgi:thioredoxin reductase
MERYDAIAIGSGMGGLTTAAIMLIFDSLRPEIAATH